MNKAAKKWVKALRSGKYKQTDGELANSSRTAFCCLGVACELAKSEGVIKDYTPCDGGLPASVQNWLGLSSQMGDIEGRKFGDLTEYNDVAKFSFKRIANLIEKKPRGLFLE